MTNKKPIDLTSDEIYPIGWGVIFKPVCSPAKFTDQEISDLVSAQDPPGTSLNRWEVTTNPETLKDTGWSSDTPRIPCPDCENRVHILLNC